MQSAQLYMSYDISCQYATNLLKMQDLEQEAPVDAAEKAGDVDASAAEEPGNVDASAAEKAGNAE